MSIKNTAQQVLSSLFLHTRRPSEAAPQMAPGERLRTLRGAAFAFSGRAYGAKKAASFCIKKGSVPFNSLHADIDFASVMQKTRNGSWGFRT